MTLRLSVALSLVALLVLAGLQYRWIGRITVIERERLQRSVEDSADDLAQGFLVVLRNLAVMVEPRPSAPSEPPFIAQRYREWTATARYPGLVKTLYVARPGSELLRLDDASMEFEAVPWPAELAPITEFVDRRQPERLRLEADVLVFPLNRRFPDLRGGRGGGGPGWDWQARAFEGEGWIIAELDRAVIVGEVLPALAESELVSPDSTEPEYRIAVVTTQDGRSQTVYTSGDAWTEADLAMPDYQRDLLAQGPGRRGSGIGTGGRGRGGQRGFRPLELRGPAATHIGPGWRLLVKHSAGSVETAVTQFRQRNLALSFGVLVVLGIGALTMVISGNRARRLGQLQLDFAAGISHELRTPLAVIQSAAHNLKTGVVRDPESIEQYAAIVQTEARRLSEMVEQVMTYTETQSGKKKYNPVPVDVSEIVDMAIRNLAAALRDSNATVRKRIDPDLPQVIADPAALTRSLQNLLSNAVKYGRGGESAEIEVEAAQDSAGAPPGSVRLSVIDRGPGVPEADKDHLFEAFYRGSNVTTNTPGNGLGLHLVHRIMEAQKGTVTYERASTGGAKFTLTLPAAAGSA